MRKIVKVLAVVLVFVICLSFCGCVSKSDVVGVWKCEEYNNNYLYFYKNGTCDECRSEGDHVLPKKWELKDGDVVIESPRGYIDSYTISDGKMLDQQGNIEYTKVSDDPSVDIK